MIRVVITFSGPIRRPWPAGRRTVQIEGDSTLSDLLDGLGFAGPEQRSLHSAVNGDTARPTTVLRDADEVEVRLRAGGG